MFFGPRLEKTLRDMFKDIVRSGPVQAQFSVPERWIQIELYKRLSEHKHFPFVVPGEPPFRSGFRPKSNKSDSLFVDVCAEYCPSGDATEFLWMELKVEARPDTNQGWSGLLNNDVPKLLQIQVGKTAQKWGDAKEWWHDRSLKGKVSDLKSCASHRFVCAYLQVNREEATMLSKELLDAPIPSVPAHLEAIVAKRIQRFSYPLKVKGCPSVLSMLMWTASADELRP